MNLDTTLKAFLTTDIIQLALRLALVSAFIWSIAGAVVFVIKGTRAEKLFGAEFDPEKPISTRRKS